MRGLFSLLVGLALGACSANDGDAGSSLGNAAASGNGGSAAGSSAGNGGFAALGGNGGSGAVLNTDGGLGGNGATAGNGGNAGVCGDTLIATIRDTTPAKNPDFEKFSGSAAYKGLLLDTLGADLRPVYASTGPTPQTTGPAVFYQWYHDTPNVNIAVPFTIKFTQPTPGHYVYDDQTFFPVDGKGFGNYLASFPPHNFHFTTEIHTLFTYKGGEKFTFTGDDDLWVFVNRELAIDLGGLHSSLSDTADFDALASTLGLTVGQSYPMDIFHAERHTADSTFHIETTIECFVPVDPPH